MTPGIGIRSIVVATPPGCIHQQGCCRKKPVRSTGSFLIAITVLAAILGNAGPVNAGSVNNALSVTCMVVAKTVVSVNHTDSSRQYPNSLNADALADAITVSGTDGYVVSLDENSSTATANETIYGSGIGGSGQDVTITLDL